MDNDNPSAFKGDNRPVETVSWDNAQEFIRKLNEITGKAYRLPTEAEWEYAARGGKQSEGYKYAGSNQLKEVGWYDANSYGETKPVGMKAPNELGLYDMSGNVYELIEDQWHDNYDGAPSSGAAWKGKGEYPVRVVRGGSWGYGLRFCRCANRFNNGSEYRSDDVGFRLALPFQFTL